MLLLSANAGEDLEDTLVQIADAYAYTGNRRGAFNEFITLAKGEDSPLVIPEAPCVGTFMDSVKHTYRDGEREEDDSGLEDAIMDIVDFQEKTGVRVCESGTVMTMGSFPGPIKNRKAWNKVWSEDDPVMEEFANSMGSRYREIWE